VFGTILKFSPKLMGYEIYSNGHRNPQGLFFSIAKNKLYESEHGPSGGDEINLIEKGDHYGWPYVSFGNAYGWPVTDGAPYKFSVESANTKFEDQLKTYGFIRGSHKGYSLPLMSWAPSIAASALAEVPDSPVLSDWKGNIILSTLQEKALHRIVIENDVVVLDEKILLNFRIRDIVVMKSGIIFIATDEGQLVSMRIVRNDGKWATD
jgi:glucose/arabinose dehydrogenase